MGVVAASLAMLTALLWGGTAVAISFSVDTLPPVAVAGLRFSMAVVVMIVWCLRAGKGFRIKAAHWRLPAIAGFMLFCQISLFNWGVLISNSSHGSLLINSAVFGVVALEHFVTKNDRLNVTKSLGLMLAASCVIAILLVTGSSDEASATGDRPSLFGDLLLLISACVLAVKVIFTKYAVKFVPPGKLILWHDVVAVALFFSYSLLFEEWSADGFTWQATLGLLYQGIFVAGLCFAIQAHLLQHHSASQISVFSFAMPLFGMMFGNIFRGDPLSGWIVVAGVGVALGIVLVNAPQTWFQVAQRPPRKLQPCEDNDY